MMRTGKQPHLKKESVPCGSLRFYASSGRGINPVNRDFRDLLAEFNVQGVEYLIVGAHALAAHGHVRATKDLDVWVRPDEDNAKRVLRALEEYGTPLHNLTETDLAKQVRCFRLACRLFEST